MKIKALCTFRGDEGMIRRGAVVDVSDVYGKDLIKRGRAIAVAGSEKPAPAPKPTKPLKGAPASSEGE